MEAPPSPLSSRPKRTRISYFALLATTTCAALRKESRMQIIKATGLDRKSGGAQWRDLRFSGPFLEMFFDRGVMGLRPTQGDEKRLLSTNDSAWKHRPPLCHLDRSAAQWRDLRFSGPFLEMFFDRVYPDFLLRAARDDHVCGSR